MVSINGTYCFDHANRLYAYLHWYQTYAEKRDLFLIMKKRTSLCTCSGLRIQLELVGCY